MFSTRSGRAPSVVAVSAGALTAVTCVLVPPAGAAPATAPNGPSTTARCAVLAPGAAAGAREAVRNACSMQGTPYSWGGGHGARPGPTTGHFDGNPASRDAATTVGFDCSGLVRWAYADAAGRDLIGPADTDTYYKRARHDGMRHITPAQGLAGLLPGDLLFYRDGHGSIHHVTMYIGAGEVVQAQRSGTRVGVSPADLGGEYIGAIRVLLPGESSGPLLPSPHPARAVPLGLGPALVRRPPRRAPAAHAPAARPKQHHHNAPTAPARSNPDPATPKPAPEPKPQPKPAPSPVTACAPKPAPKPSGGLNLLGNGGVLDGVTSTLSGLLGGRPNG